MKADILKVIEAAYADGADDASWVRGLAEAALPALNGGMGLLAYTFGKRPDGSTELGADACLGSTGFSRATIEAMQRLSPPEEVAAAFSSNVVSTLSDFFHATSIDKPHWAAPWSPLGVRDLLGVVAVDASGEGVSLAAALHEPRRLSPRFRRPWLHVLGHLAAGLRLRKQRRASSAGYEALLDPSGKVQDALGPARDKSARVALRRAARAIDRARCSNVDLEGALDSWRALVEGRWSLVDRFDSDGRRFLVARRNPPEPPALAELSDSERHVVALVALGRSNKLVAYDLGLFVGTVATHLVRAARKLGARSRSHMIFEWQRRQRDGFRLRNATLDAT